ncbi:thioredoxin family protein [Notoacmeibacter sp. MSK16QG-6]|uniref:DUF1223 domain-containing protein n=1 Tax=Notoacmeibacter sp. MSK16QG-6 TaxID=2957982 RepID=UPI00209FCD61|nr:DUF1223 domain-containing protein [Notoacmeibacter sp. MSK16QG-6]MCP1198548.1 DUF1223 domain-containing protein [Notoacmeibacter sp. MSK16QG-6]
MKLLIGLFAGLCLSTSALAQSHPLTVVELFTSQGCNSCPPADAYLEDLAEREDVLALGYHVDYWDRLGWKDTLGDPAFTARQYGYAQTLQRKGVYTPQAVINGSLHLVGSNRPAIDALIAEDKDADEATLSLNVSKDAEISVSISGAQKDDPSLRLTIVHYRNEALVPIERGENAGKTIAYVNAVRSVETLALPADGEALSVSRSEEGEGLAILLQVYSPKGAPGAILAAARY